MKRGTFNELNGRIGTFVFGCALLSVSIGMSFLVYSMFHAPKRIQMMGYSMGFLLLPLVIGGLLFSLFLIVSAFLPESCKKRWTND